jgi:KDO2-lipid IV(A) lauroyltransferase
MLFRLVGSLPLPFQWALANVLWWVGYRLIGYRVAVVRANLAAAFPDVDPTERQAIERQFYRHLCDMFVETLALSRQTPRHLGRRWQVDYAQIDRLIDESGQSLILLVSHQFNWEAGSWILQPHIRHPQAVVYTSISDRAFERAFLEVRQANGQRFLSEKEMVCLFRLLRERPHVVLLAADQSPFSLAAARWCRFFHRPTPFHQGIEEVARRTHSRVAFLELVRQGRGRYEARIHPWDVDWAAAPAGELTEAYVRFVEASIARQPANYLWTHRRWKHSHRWREFLPTEPA